MHFNEHSTFLEECYVSILVSVIIWNFNFYYDIFLGVGKTSIVHLIVKGSSIARPSQTIGCTVDVKVRTYLFIYAFFSDSERIYGAILEFMFSLCLPFQLSSTLLTETRVALQAASKAIANEIFLWSFGIFLDMTDTKIVDLFSIHKLMASSKSRSLLNIQFSWQIVVYFKSKQVKRLQN